MKLKLDENLGTRGALALRGAGHDVMTVQEQDLAAATDVALAEVCRTEGRALVTLDLDFSNPIRFPPARYAGIAVLRLSAHPSQTELDDAIATLAAALERENLASRLWVVQRGRIRQYQPEEESGA